MQLSSYSLVMENIRVYFTPPGQKINHNQVSLVK